MVDLKHLSYSSISTYLLCPQSWAYRYVEKIKAPSSPGLVFGSAFHGTIENLLKARHLGQPNDLSDTWAANWAKQIEQEIDWQEETPEALHALGHQMITSVDMQQFLAARKPLIQEGLPVIEKYIELKVPGVPIPIIGYIDLIEADGVPCDFKTAARAWSKGKEQEEQQPLFYLAALNQAGVNVPGNRFRHFVFVKTKSPKIQELEAQHTYNDMFRLFGTIKQVWNAIQAEVFPRNQGTWKCSEKWCEHYTRCHS